MLGTKFQYGTVAEFIAGEDIKNNDVYIVDPKEQKIRKPTRPNEWITCQVVYVCNITPYVDDIIHAGTECRCWIVHLVI